MNRRASAASLRGVRLGADLASPGTGPSPRRRSCPRAPPSPGVFSIGVGLSGEQRLVDLEAVARRGRSPSAGTWSPVRSSRRSSSTTSSTAISDVLPSRTTRARGALSTARRSSVCFARVSWTMPISEFATRMRPNSASWSWPTTRMITSIVPRIALKRVRTLARMISPYVRLVRSPASFVSPCATRSRTSSRREPRVGRDDRRPSSVDPAAVVAVRTRPGRARSRRCRRPRARGSRTARRASPGPRRARCAMSSSPAPSRT